MTCLEISDNCCQLILFNTDLHTIATRSKCQNCQSIKTSISPSVNSFLGGIISLTFLWKRWHLKQPVINLQFSCIFCIMFWKPTVKLFSFFFDYTGKPFLTLSLSLWLYVEIYVYRQECTWRKIAGILIPVLDCAMCIFEISPFFIPEFYSSKQEATNWLLLTAQSSN